MILSSRRHRASDLANAMELCFKNGWTDGLPVVPPTESRVMAFLERGFVEPDRIIGEIPERAVAITAEKLAVNAVMAGCLPEYMPILLATVEAVTDPQFKFNHLASLGSPWPLIIVNGPIVKDVGLNSGSYVFGPGSRPNASIARALSLLLANCAEARNDGVQRGQWGHSGRWGGCIAENEDTPWIPLHVQRGFDRNSSAVTVVSTHPELPCPVATMNVVNKPAQMLDPLCYSISHHGGSLWHRGVYTVMIGPHHAEAFSKEGWSKDDVRAYVVENTKASVAELKRRRAWGFASSNMTEEMGEIQPGDENQFLYLFKSNGECDKIVFERSGMEDRAIDVFVVVAGGNAGHRIAFAFPYPSSTNPVTKPIRVVA